ncbi:Rha family transcriptional regulator, partial [Glaesserella parasuis]
MKTELLSTNQRENATLTMSSREIARITESRHRDVCLSIRNLMNKGVIGGYAESPYTHEQNGQVYYEYHINKRDTYVIVAQFSPEFTARLVDRWQEL